jgi:hypothetical protein
MQNERLLELMSRSLSGEASPEELQELDAILAADAKAMARYRTLQQFWNEHDAVSPATVEDALHRLLNQLQLQPSLQETTLQHDKAPVRRLHRRWTFWAAAVAVLFIGTIVYWLVKAIQSIRLLLALWKTNARGTKSIIELTDGSKIWLNADSKLNTPKSSVATHARCISKAKLF